MIKKLLTLKVYGFFYIPFIFLHCTENPIGGNLAHLPQNFIDTTLYNISGYPYWIDPNLGSTDRLYFGSKNGLNAKINLIEMPNSGFWSQYLDSSVTLDSLLFRVYSDDSLLSESMADIQLYFSPDSHFNESNSTYRDFDNFTLDGWQSLGPGALIAEKDSSGLFIQTEISWDLMHLRNALADTLDTSLVRSFAIMLESDESTFIELFSREATTGAKDPKIEIFYSQPNSSDSSIIDNLSTTIYANKDITVMDYGDIPIDTSDTGVSLGFGQRMILSINFSLPKGALIKNANLILAQDSSLAIPGYNLILDPLIEALDTSSIKFINDPFVTMGYPWTMGGTIENSSVIIGMKYYLQNVNMDNTENIGLKLLPASLNNPFEKASFLFNSDTNKPRLEIIYVIS
tara:strand:+ start:5726 stop:6931 length:1206 start_codon:yes stop_codon:yes gene_type:complete